MSWACHNCTFINDCSSDDEIENEIICQMCFTSSEMFCGDRPSQSQTGARSSSSSASSESTSPITASSESASPVSASSNSFAQSECGGCGHCANCSFDLSFDGDEEGINVDIGTPSVGAVEDAKTRRRKHLQDLSPSNRRLQRLLWRLSSDFDLLPHQFPHALVVAEIV